PRREMRRRGYTFVSSLAVALGIVSGAASGASAARDPAGYVNPFSGTAAGAPNFGTGGGAANTFPGPVVPFGMIQWGPDTSPGSDNAAGGYAYDYAQNPWFSLKRRSDAGAENEVDLPHLHATRLITSSSYDATSTDYDGSLLPL